MNKPRLASILLVTGIFLIWLDSLLVDAARGIFRSEAFAERAAASLADPRVSTYVANRITDAVVAQRPDLIAVRPLLVGATGGLVESAPFRAVARTALRAAHASVFSRTGEQVMLAAPDVCILLRNALAGANPELAARIPDRLQSVATRLEKSRVGAVLARLRTFWERLRWLGWTLIIVGPALIAVSILVQHDRRSGLVRAGVGLIIAGLLLALLVPLGRLVALRLIPTDDAARAAFFGVWRTYFLGLFSWATTLAGTGVVLAAAGTSLYEGIDPFERMRTLAKAALQPPATKAWRILWALIIAAVGTVVLIWPASVVTATAVLGGLLLIYVALREVFRLVLEGVPQGLVTETSGGWGRLAFVLTLAAALIAGILLWQRPTAAVVVSGEMTSCNGSPLLCDRPVDQVVFPGAHNAMSSAGAVGWMFPQHHKGIPEMLQDGVRALMLDIHYGIQGDERVRTDFDKEQVSQEKIEQALGPEATAAALRIRDRIVVGSNSKADIYFCHGFCELGAYLALPVLRQVRDFMVEHPNEVVILLIEDYILPEDLGQAFKEAGLDGMVDTSAVTGPWPTLRQLIEANQRLIVFTESGRPGVLWLHPTLGTIQETPYTFHQPADFSCKPNRGGDTGSLFLINHWIESTPAPKPTNAAIVNAYDFLLKRARECQRVRRHLPNVIAVDFYDTGDLFRVARTLNGLPDSLMATK